MVGLVNAVDCFVRAKQKKVEKNNNQLNRLVQKLLKIEGIEKVKRIDK